MFQKNDFGETEDISDVEAEYVIFKTEEKYSLKPSILAIILPPLNPRTVRSAATPRTPAEPSPKLRCKSALTRSSADSEKIARVNSRQLVLIKDENAIEQKKVEETYLDFYFSSTCGYIEYECNNELVEFPETPLYCESVQTYALFSNLNN